MSALQDYKKAQAERKRLDREVEAADKVLEAAKQAADDARRMERDLRGKAWEEFIAFSDLADEPAVLEVGR